MTLPVHENRRVGNTELHRKCDEAVNLHVNRVPMPFKAETVVFIDLPAILETEDLIKVQVFRDRFEPL